VPFAIKRVFYLYDVPGGESRAGHALKDVDQVLIAMSGSFDVVLDNGASRETATLNRSYFGLMIPSLIWREIDNFSSGAVCLVLASERYDENAYYRVYGEFLAAVRQGM
jgi:WxcM-like, C-terminal